ncbi:MAG: hypothetical protein K7J15_05350, partial [Candidatus Regiella insecticola]|nr:hypothetical protein [Candidatus Regiella insecticola]
GDLNGQNPLTLTNIFDYITGILGTLLSIYLPTDNLTAKNIEEKLEVKILAFNTAREISDIPTIELVGGGGTECP